MDKEAVAIAILRCCGARKYSFDKIRKIKGYLRQETYEVGAQISSLPRTNCFEVNKDLTVSYYAGQDYNSEVSNFLRWARS